MVNDNINQNWLDGHLFILRQVMLKDSCISQYENQEQYY